MPGPACFACQSACSARPSARLRVVALRELGDAGAERDSVDRGRHRRACVQRAERAPRRRQPSLPPGRARTRPARDDGRIRSRRRRRVAARPCSARRPPPRGRCARESSSSPSRPTTSTASDSTETTRLRELTAERVSSASRRSVSARPRVETREAARESVEVPLSTRPAASLWRQRQRASTRASSASTVSSGRHSTSPTAIVVGLWPERALRLFAEARGQNVCARLPRLRKQDRELAVATPARDVALARDSREESGDLVDALVASPVVAVSVPFRPRPARPTAGARSGAHERPRGRARARSHGGSRRRSRDREGAALRRRRSGARSPEPGADLGEQLVQRRRVLGRNASAVDA